MAGQVNGMRARHGFSAMNEDEIWLLFTNNENAAMLPREAHSLFESVRAVMRGSAQEASAPASRASIESLAVVTNSHDKEKSEEECPICLEKLFNHEKGEEVKKMPCRHLYHGECIATWLGIHRSCPVCRYHMPHEEMEEEEDEDIIDIGFWMLIPF
ncbi:hypothetical protein LUZ63_008070 [Rhynchospora breviuscula]|uniref:RING-type E3 ubiquitin transferase n=1 Tax=Rhynchospora breviuscula TaxID=2022672 RepID=A0A9Q0CT84_9POAL|nr:hypothetical protein LUZ63_008070 [Rhynchospora breviuscula]